MKMLNKKIKPNGRKVFFEFGQIDAYCVADNFRLEVGYQTIFDDDTRTLLLKLRSYDITNCTSEYFPPSGLQLTNLRCFQTAGVVIQHY